MWHQAVIGALTNRLKILGYQKIWHPLGHNAEANEAEDVSTTAVDLLNHVKM